MCAYDLIVVDKQAAEYRYVSLQSESLKKCIWTRATKVCAKTLMVRDRAGNLFKQTETLIISWISNER